MNSSLSVASCSLLFLAGLMTTGCESMEDCSLTYRVWNGDLGHRRVWAPAPEPRLALYEAPKQSDILVEYDELSDPRGKVQRRAYWLQQSQPAVANGKKPKFVNLAIAGDLTPISILGTNRINELENMPQPDESQPQLHSMCAALMPNNEQFKIFLEGRVETYRLPIYTHRSGVALQIFLTPLAVTGDTAMVAGVIAVAGAVAWASAGAPYPCR